MAAKDKFAAMLARENRASSAGRTDKAALAAVHDAVARHYAAVAAAFTYYAAASAGGGGDPHHLSLNGFTAFLDDAGVPDPDSAGAKRSDCDTAFIVSVFVADKKSAEYAVLDEHAMMRFQFLEAIVRIGEGGGLELRRRACPLAARAVANFWMHSTHDTQFLLNPTRPFTPLTTTKKNNSHRQVRPRPADGRPRGGRRDAAHAGPAARAAPGAARPQRVPRAARLHGGGRPDAAAQPGLRAWSCVLVQ
jgi:hypothetical protein